MKDILLNAALLELAARRRKILSGCEPSGMSIGDVDMVNAAIEKGIDRKAIEDCDSKVWDIVAEGDLRSVCAYLLANNVEFNRISVDYSPLMLAVLSGNAEIVRMMLEHGWDSNEWTDIDNETPLTLAAYKGFKDIFFLLLEKGANLHLVGYDHEYDMMGERFDVTAGDLLFDALVGRDVDICRFLIDNLADGESWLRCGRIPWHLYGEETREFCLTSGIEFLSSRFVPMLDEHFRTVKRSRR